MPFSCALPFSRALHKLQKSLSENKILKLQTLSGLHIPKFGNFKPCPDYIFRTASKYKRKFTPNFTISLFTFSLPLLSQILNYKNPTKIGVFLLKRTTFQPLINIQWKVSSISLCMQVNFPIFLVMIVLFNYVMFEHLG